MNVILVCEECLFISDSKASCPKCGSRHVCQYDDTDDVEVAVQVEVVERITYKYHAKIGTSDILDAFSNSKRLLQCDDIPSLKERIAGLVEESDPDDTEYWDTETTGRSIVVDNDCLAVILAKAKQKALEVLEAKKRKEHGGTIVDAMNDLPNPKEQEDGQSSRM